jgi:hypothetical protein
MPRHYKKKQVPAVDWALLAKTFPSHREHILRIKNNPEKLKLLSQRLISQRVIELRALRDGKETNKKVASSLSVRTSAVKKFFADRLPFLGKG